MSTDYYWYKKDSVEDNIKNIKRILDNWRILILDKKMKWQLIKK